ncbi:hypothetical protein Hanom_Chr05g00392451 [Helianthus anomalus]
MMGPPPNILRDEMVKRLATSKPQAITNLKLITSQTVPKPTLSDDSTMSELMNLQSMNEWEQEGDSRKPLLKDESMKIKQSWSNRLIGI